MKKLVQAIVTTKTRAEVPKLRHIRKEIGQRGDSCRVSRE